MAGNKDDGDMVSRTQLPLELESVDVGQVDVENQTSRQLQPGLHQVFGDGAERDGVEARRGQQLGQGLPHARIVVDDVDDMVSRSHVASEASIGRLKLKVTPGPSLRTTQMSPA